MPQHTSVPTEIILEILACLPPLDQLPVLRAFPRLADLMTPRHISMDEHGNTTLHILASFGNYVADIVQQLLPHVEAYIDCHNQRGETALMYAAACGHELTVRLLLKNNSNVNAWKTYRNTALSYAVENGHEGVVRILLDQPGVNVNPWNKYRETPLLRAIKNGYHDITKLLLAHKNINPSFCDAMHQNALILACKKGLEELFEILVSREGMDINSPDYWRKTTVTYAAFHGHTNILRRLLALGAEADPMTGQGRTPLSYGAWAGKADIVELLLARDDVRADSVDDCGRTPLSYAAEGDSQVVRLLLAHGTRPDSVDIKVRTPISYAEEIGDEEILALLTSSRGNDAVSSLLS
ncbi:hypothetical protein CNMCM5793_000682 [Aspergillus hiratsukae]|uniref:Ankyrin repeat-containing domain protein n=1 Tax=Aspergillus hiratsukae TaxID=1194566 RepID=A0A8H6UPI5_9EURO|nr:hypothetical protein CNMCM5793_000682 [Aspergillus hiratsukae]KAF7159434.1 hypothetical protein CNMCM6106_006707 [Aspergillus hiratsukae]